MSAADRIELENVSKFYGEVLGVNRVTLSVPPGITSLVGPNGSGKTTLLNLMTGLVHPTRGRVSVLGVPPDEPEEFFRRVGYCAQFDSFPSGMSGREFVETTLRLHGETPAAARAGAERALRRVGLGEAADRRIAGYSKGMRQRVKLAQALAHEPRVLVLDEPLNGLDPLARSEAMALFRAFAREGHHLIVSSHILHEVDAISDRVILLSSGYVVAEGAVEGVRGEMQRHPMQFLVRCDRPGLLAARLFEQDHVVEVQVHDDGRGLLVRTRDAARFHDVLARAVLEAGLDVEALAPADDDVHAVYRYLLGSEGEGA